MSRLSILLLTLWALGVTAQQVRPTLQDGEPANLKRNLYFLASDSLQGRKAGSSDALTAANYLAEQYRSMGAQPLFEDYLISFSMKELSGTVATALAMSGDVEPHYRNVAVLIPGSDPVLRQEYIIVGAHYDHLGVKNGDIYNGADDNASGTVAVVELARRLLLRQKELKRSVVIVNFDAEEIGLLGSQALAERLEHEASGLSSLTDANTLTLDRCRLMMSVDMVGWLQASGHLTLEGAATFVGGKKLLQESAEKCDIKVNLKAVETSALTATDTEPFAKKGVPTLAITTGLKSPYHKPGDDAELIDFEGLNRVVDYLTEVSVELCRLPELKSSGVRAEKHSGHVKTLNAGLTGTLGHSGFHLPEAHLYTENGRAWQIGATMMLNFAQNTSLGMVDNLFLSLRTGAMYDHAKTSFPDLSAPLTNTLTIKQSGLWVPLTLRGNLHMAGMTFFIGGGVYGRWSIRDDSPYVMTDPTWGWIYEAGLRIGHFELSGMSGRQIGETMTGVKNIWGRTALTYWIF